MSENPELDPQSYLQLAKLEVQNWETRKPGYIAQVADFVINPALKLASQMVPEAVETAAANAVESALRLVAKVGEFAVDEKVILEKRSLLLEKIDSPILGAKLKICDDLASEYWNWHLGYGFAEGGGTGAFGLPGLIVDIPLILSIVIREIRSIGLCYGYDTTKPEEIDYILHVLRVGSSGDIKVKVEFLLALKEFEQILLKVAWKQMSKELAAKQLSQGAVLAAVREFAKSLGIQLTKRKALQLVPVIGALIGASFNAVFTNDIGRAAYMCYRRRFILENQPPDGPSTSVSSATGT